MRILVTGACGRLGTYVMAQRALPTNDVVGSTRQVPDAAAARSSQQMDLADHASVAEALRLVDPDMIIHLAAIASADEAWRDPALAWKINVEGTRLLVDWAARKDRRLVYASTDLVFDGARSWYGETDPANPVLEYGRTKAAAERVAGESPLNLTVRLSLLYGNAPSGREGFFDRAVASLKAGIPLEFFGDEYRTPLDYATAAKGIAKLAESNICGIIHLGGPERLSRFELMRRAAAALGIDPGLVRPNRLADQALAEPRPADVSLDTTRLKNELPELSFPSIEAAVRSLDS